MQKSLILAILGVGSFLCGCSTNPDETAYARWHEIDSTTGRNFGESMRDRSLWEKSAVPKVNPTGANALPDRYEYWQSVRPK